MEAAAKIIMKRIFPFIVILAAAGSGWWYCTDRKPRPEYSGFIEAEDVSVGSKTGGRVMKVNVHEGDAVQAGDVLIELDREPAEARLHESEAGLQLAMKRRDELENGSRPQDIERARALFEQARQQWQLLVNGPRVEDIHAAQANVEAASADLNLASLTAKRQRELFAKKDTTADNLDRAEKELSVARNRQLAARAELEKLRAGFRVEEIQAARAQMESASAALSLAVEGPRKEQIEQARAEVDRAKAAVERARIDLQEAVITAPDEAVVEVSRLQPGDLLTANQTALTLILYVPIWVRIYIPESFLGAAAVGRTLGLSVNAYPGKVFTGKIVQVNRKAEFTPRNVQTPQTRDDLVFGVKIEIDDPERLLRPGMVADVLIPTSKNIVEN